MRARSRGFTLIEVLVVIAITGLVSVLAMQMTTVMLKGYEQMGRIQGELGETTLRNRWFRASLEVMAASLDEEFAFQGDAGLISGYTMAPLFGAPGELTKIEWSLSGTPEGVALWYREHSYEPVKIGQWSAKRATFAYRGQRSNWLDTWPVGDLPEGVLPYRVKLSVVGDEQTEDVFAAIKVRRSGRYDYRDFLD